jgi:hypothetical protein
MGLSKIGGLLALLKLGMLLQAYHRHMFEKNISLQMQSSNDFRALPPPTDLENSVSSNILMEYGRPAT